MQDMAQMKYDHMFAGVPMYGGTDPDSFDDWLYQIESLCEVSLRDCHIHCFESKDEPTQMTKQSFTIIYFITFKKTIHFKLICKNVHS